MSNLSAAAPLLLDALQQTLINPNSSHRWHTLIERYYGGVTEEEQSRARNTVLTKAPSNGEAGFFRATFLAAITGNRQFSAEAAHIALRIQPFDADRLMAFTVFEWGRVITLGGGREQFLQTLRQVHLHELAACIGEQLSVRASLPQRAIKQLKKVALVTSYIGSDNHPPTLLAFQQAQLLQTLGMEVHLFSAQDALIPQMNQYLGNNGSFTLAPPELTALKRLIPDKIKVSLADTRFSLMRRWQDILASIAIFDPDLVMFVGFNAPIMTPLYATRPCLGLCSQSVSPLAAVDVWLAARANEANRLNEDWAPALPAAWGHYHPYRVALKPTGAPLLRAQWGLPEKAVVLVSVGARLASEIRGDWAARMVALLREHPQVIWLLVGGEGARPSALAALPEGQLRLLPYQTDIRRVLHCCDIYVNPDRMGGGFSVAEAMAEGLPTLALVNSDGGDKLAETAAPDMNAYIEQLQALLTNPALRQQQGKAMQVRFNNTLDLTRSGPSLKAACELTVARFQERVGAVFS